MFGVRRVNQDWDFWDDWRVSQTACNLSLYIEKYRDVRQKKGMTSHSFLYGCCNGCGIYWADSWDVFPEEDSEMPRGLTSVTGEKGAATWAPQIDKEQIENTPFFIHGTRLSTYQGEDGREVQLIIADITVNDPSPKGPRAVVTFGLTEDRQSLLEAFEDSSEPIGPVVTYKVPIKGGMSFWRLEEAPQGDAAEAAVFQPATPKRR